MRKCDCETAENRAKVMDRLIDKVEKKLVYLYERWQDEKEHEDFSDYGKAIKEEVGREFVMATKRPFGFIVQMKGFPYKTQISVDRGCISWKSI